MLLVARSALDRWEAVKNELDATAALVTDGRYSGSSKASSLLAVEVRARAAFMSALGKVSAVLA